MRWFAAAALVALLFAAGCSDDSSSDGGSATTVASDASIDVGELQQWMQDNYGTTEWHGQLTQISGNGPTGVIVTGNFDATEALDACKATLEFTEEEGVIDADIEVTDGSGETALATSTADECEQA